MGHGTHDSMRQADPEHAAFSRAGDGTGLCGEFLGQADSCHGTLTFVFVY